MQRVLKDKLSRNWFSQRELQKWNSLTIEEVKAGKASGFKAQYDKKDALRKRVVENAHFGPNHGWSYYKKYVYFIFKVMVPKCH